MLKKNEIRVLIDDGDDTIGKKIRTHRKMQPAYMVILGEGEAPCINEQYEFDGIKYRVLKCHSFVNDASKFKATLIKTKIESWKNEKDQF